MKLPLFLYRLLGIGCVISCISLQPLLGGNPDSLQQEISRHLAANNKKELIGAYILLGDGYNKTFDYPAAVNAYKSALNYLNEANEPEKVFLLNEKIGWAYFMMDKYPDALTYFNDAREAGAEKVSEAKLAGTLSKISYVYMSLGNYKQALYYQLQAQEIRIRINDTPGLAETYSQLGQLYWHREQYDLSIDYLKKALKMYRELGQDVNDYTVVATLAISYIEKEDIEEARRYAKESLDIAREADYTYGLAYSQGLMGTIARMNRQLPESETNLKAAILQFGVLKSELDQIDYTIELAQTYMAQGRYALALDSLRSATDDALRIGAKPSIMQGYQFMAECSEALGRVPEAYRLLRQYNLYRDSLISQKTMEQMTDMENEFEIQRRERMILELQQQGKLTRQRWTLLGLSSGIGLLAVILWLVYNRYVTQRHTNDVLQQKNTEIQRQNELLASSNTEMAQFAGLAAHDLRQPVLHIKDALATLEQETAGGAVGEGLTLIKHQTQRLEQLLASIAMYTITEAGEEEPESLDLADALSLAITQLPEESRRKVRIKVQGLPTLVANKRQIVVLFQQLIANSIRLRGTQDPEIHISARQDGDYWRIVLKDNGKGIPPEDFDMLFKIFSKPGSQVDSIGLALCKRIVEQHKGAIWAESAPDKGTSFVFTLPDLTL
ncbi:MAG: tetratricopeptide repeat-containing sensor histidine kinase [Bacteroidia bacterium]|nr:tetratricopeptide repeat-containing sensor histidine kinase [Bacteroidia bacterium]